MSEHYVCMAGMKEVFLDYAKPPATLAMVALDAVKKAGISIPYTAEDEEILVEIQQLRVVAGELKRGPVEEVMCPVPRAGVTADEYQLLFAQMTEGMPKPFVGMSQSLIHLYDAPNRDEELGVVREVTHIVKQALEAMRGQTL